jgi:hypothetical protein
MIKFIARVIERTEAIKMGTIGFDNNDGSTLHWCSKKNFSYIKLKEEGAELLTGGEPPEGRSCWRLLY